MSYSTLITDYVGKGTAAARPASPNIVSTALAFYYATDTLVLSLWNGSAWVTVNASGPAGPTGPTGCTGPTGPTGP